MRDLQKLQYNWRNFAVDRGRARRLVQDEVDALQAEIAERRDKIQFLEQDFEDTWKQKKLDTRAALDEAVKAALRTGRTAQSILKELGSSNTVWIYGLAAEVREEPITDLGEKAEQLQIESFPDADLEGVSWLHHDHTGVHRWLLSDDGRYIKRYGAEGSQYEGEWFVANRDYSFVAGSKGLYDATTRPEMGKRISMLEKLLQGTYTGKIKLAPNQWTA
jgi:hypothetical protein